MPQLNWVRYDCATYSHPKMLTLMGMGAKGAKAVAVWHFGLGWSGQHGLGGLIPDYALPMIHGTQADARLLMQVGLWERVDGGWQMHNYHLRNIVGDPDAADRSQRARDAANARWHGKGKRAGHGEADAK